MRVIALALSFAVLGNAVAAQESARPNVSDVLACENEADPAACLLLNGPHFLGIFDVGYLSLRRRR